MANAVPAVTPPDLAEFDAILLDMNGTFMFGHDRFGEKEDYGRTNYDLGGRALDTSAVRHIVAASCEELAALKCPPDRTVFVGDYPHADIGGAQAVGMRAVLVGDRCMAGIEPDWRVPSIVDLAKTIRGT